MDLQATNPRKARPAMIFFFALAAAHPSLLEDVLSYDDPTEAAKTLAERFPDLPGAGALITDEELVLVFTATPAQIKLATDMGRDPDQPWSAAHDGYQS